MRGDREDQKDAEPQGAIGHEATLDVAGKGVGLQDVNNYFYRLLFQLISLTSSAEAQAETLSVFSEHLEEVRCD